MFHRFIEDTVGDTVSLHLSQLCNASVGLTFLEIYIRRINTLAETMLLNSVLSKMYRASVSFLRKLTVFPDICTETFLLGMDSSTFLRPLFLES